MEKLLSELTRILYLNRAVGFSRAARFNLAPKKGFHINFFYFGNYSLALGGRGIFAKSIDGNT
jgi:hypothetical protein